MRIRIIAVGKTKKEFLKEGEEEFMKRLKHYIKLEEIIIPDIKNAKNLQTEEIKKQEGKKILELIKGESNVILLDENGKEKTSRQFSDWLQELFNRGGKQITFVIGGAYGFSKEVYDAANGKLSLSKMTYSHQMVRMIFKEQLYRAFTIMNSEPYHHD